MNYANISLSILRGKVILLLLVGLAGCSTSPISSINSIEGTWKITTAEGMPIQKSTIRIYSNNRVAGESLCGRYAGKIKGPNEAEKVSIDVGGKIHSCSPSLQEGEEKVRSALDRAAQINVMANRIMTMTRGDETLLTAKRI